MLKYKNGTKVVEALGCSATELRKWIEGQFTEGMSWANYGGTGYDLGRWHIDHRIALSKFDLRDPQQIKEAFNYRNLCPVWAIVNVVKAAS